MKPTRALITGATGLIGPKLIDQLPESIVLSRNPEKASQKLSGVPAFPWQASTEKPPKEALDGVDCVFNLAGEPVAEGRWSQSKKDRIRESRVLGTKNLVQALSEMETPPRVLVSASAVGFYGDRGDEELNESASPGEGFLPEVCVEWEKEAMAAEALGIRVVCLRIGIVLAKDGGALAKMLPPFRMGAGGPLGKGRQWMPWIHIDDMIGLLLHAAQSEDLRGPVNAVAPNPETNASFTRALGKALRRPAIIPVPTTALRILFGEMTQIIIASQRCIPKAAQESGYGFKYPDLNAGLSAILKTL